GRKVILLTSGCCYDHWLGCLGAFFYYKTCGGRYLQCFVLPVPALVVYNIVYCIGLGPLPWLLWVKFSYIVGKLTETIGRKWVLLTAAPIFIISFILMMIASEVWIIIFARALQGCATGFVMTATSIYVSEISTDELRGATGSLMQLGIVTGVLYVYCIGPYVSYQALQWFCIAIPIIFASIFVFMPESPYYYVSKNRMEDATKSLQFLRGQSAAAVQSTLKEIENFIQESAAHKGTLKDVFKTAGNPVLFNTQSIFDAANTGTDSDSAISAIIVGAVQVLASALTPLIADRLGRRLILLVCSAIINALVAYYTGFLISFFFPLLNDLGTYYIFWLFAVSCAIGFLFILTVVFETKGLSLQEIQDKLNKKDVGKETIVPETIITTRF
ncbi:hypothetical protein DOY81_013807, partial [Sarcophaga bullata]